MMSTPGVRLGIADDAPRTDAVPAALDQGFSMGYRLYALGLLTLVYVFNSLDRAIMWVLVEPIKKEFGLNDTQMGLLSGFAFALVYGLAGLVLGALADRSNRVRIVTGCLAVWSFMTGLCGVTQNFVQLFVARALVGGAESGGPPAAMSVISDLFGPRSRAAAMSLFMAAPAAGIVLVYLIGSQVASQFGWRTAFWVAAVPGLVLALVALATLREPPRGMSEHRSDQGEKLGLRQTLSFIRTQRSLCGIMFAMTLATMVGIGIFSFMVSFLMRSHGMNLVDAGRLNAYAFAAPVLGVPLCGLLADRLAARDPRWLLWFSGAMVASQCVLTAVLLTTSSTTAIAWLFPLTLVCGQGWLGVAYAMVQNLVGLRMRATTISVQYVLTNVVGIGLGALIIGALSDVLAGSFGKESLRQAMLIACTGFAVAAVALLLAARSYVSDLDRAARG